MEGDKAEKKENPKVTCMACADKQLGADDLGAKCP